MDYNQIEPQLRGRWHEVLANHGIEVPPMRGKNSSNGPCPLCGGDDRAHWRETEGRLALYCRSCAAKKMKSPEQVIQEACNIGFHELCENLKAFLGGEIVEMGIAKKPASYFSAHCECSDHKYDEKEASEFIASAKLINSHPYLLRESFQLPVSFYEYDRKPCFPMRAKNGDVINVYGLSHKQSHSDAPDGGFFIFGMTNSMVSAETKHKKISRRKYLDSIPLSAKEITEGTCYESWFTIPKCQFRNNNRIYWCSSLKEAAKYWYKYGAEIRVTFTSHSVKWLIESKWILEGQTVLAIDDIEFEYYQPSRFDYEPVIELI